MEMLGGALVWVLMLAFLAAVAAIPCTVAWHLWTKAKRAHQRAHQPARQPYDDALERELWEIATANGRRDARRAIEGLNP